MGSPPNAGLSAFIAEHLGARIVDLKKPNRTMRRYAARRGFPSLQAYLDYAREHLEEELPNLHDKALVHTTELVRDRRFWKAAHAHFFAHLKPGRAVRILSLGCSNGAELATAAILAHQNVAPCDLEIDAWDISPACIAVARDPVFDNRLLPRLPLLAGRARISVTPAPGSKVRLIPELRASIRPHLGDVRAMEGDWWGAEIGAYDLVLCRNLLLYLDDAVVREIYKAIWVSLKHRRGEGFLGVGAADNRPPQTLFEGVDSMLYRPRNRPR